MFTFHLNFPVPVINPSSTPQPSGYQIRILRSTGSFLSNQPAPFNRTISIPPPESPDTHTWTVSTFNDGAGPLDYFFDLYPSSGQSIESAVVIEYTITKNSNTELYKRADIVRIAPTKYLYSDATQTETLTHSTYSTSSNLMLQAIDNNFDGGTFLSPTTTATS